jgi:hypothetical protein
VRIVVCFRNIVDWHRMSLSVAAAGSATGLLSGLQRGLINTAPHRDTYPPGYRFFLGRPQWTVRKAYLVTQIGQGAQNVATPIAVGVRPTCGLLVP